MSHKSKTVTILLYHKFSNFVFGTEIKQSLEKVYHLKKKNSFYALLM